VALDFSATVLEAFAEFRGNKSLLALPLALHDEQIESLLPLQSGDASTSFQSALNELNAVLNIRTPLYILLRREDTLTAITFIPYLAKDSQRTFFLDHRHELVQKLGEEHFSQSLICKDIGEVTDARSWTERDDNSSSYGSTSNHPKETEACNDEECSTCTVQDLGYKRNKCRLCDRRMKNNITPQAFEALKTLANPNTMVQLVRFVPLNNRISLFTANYSKSVNTTNETLDLVVSSASIQPNDLSSLLPSTFPTFTFYHHPTNSMVYFIFFSPDSASVQQRMTHTLAIPGLLVHAEDVGVHVDRKLEIHDPDDVVFEAGRDERVGRFRSMYNREGFRGTELVYEGMGRDREFVDRLG
jgi:twinfilin-like protein